MKTLCGLLISLLVFISALPSYAARGFGTTDGTGATDAIVTGHTTLNTSTSWCQWFWLTGAGGGGFGRIWDKDAIALTGFRYLYYDDVASTIRLAIAWTTAGQWTIAAPSTAAWHHLCITYAGTATTTDPIFYLDGTTPAVTEAATPVGSLETNTGAYVIGNRLTTDNRNLNGRVAELAIWEGTILSAGNVASLYNSGIGARADSLATAPTTYWKLCGIDSPEPNEILNGSTGTVTGALQKTHPFFNCTLPPTGCGAAMILLGKGAGC